MQIAFYTTILIGVVGMVLSYWIGREGRAPDKKKEVERRYFRLESDRGRSLLMSSQDARACDLNAIFAYFEVEVTATKITREEAEAQLEKWEEEARHESE